MSYYVPDSDKVLLHKKQGFSTFAYERPQSIPVSQGSWGALQESLTEANDMAQKVAAGAMKALPHVVKGAAAGARFGPYGAIIGGVAGGVKGMKQNSVVAEPAKPAPTPNTASTEPMPAAAQLLKILYRPEMLQALVMMLMGNQGPGHVKVGDTKVPAAAFANLLGSLAGQAAAEHHLTTPQYSEEIPRYLFDRYGELIGDPTTPEDRAAALFNLLEQTK